MDYSQTLAYLYSQLPMFQRVGAAAYKADLGNTIALTRILDHPENKFTSIHIAGTNGKGSVSHLLASILQEAGYKTGLYTSPHLKDFRERIRINGKMVPEEFVTQFVNKHKEKFEQVSPSFFEYTAIMAFEYFARENVDIAILETGMGGRLDSTNVVTPIISVITNISMDHTFFLGNTLTAIAKEKAGIIKHGVPVVIGETQEETRGVFIKQAQQMSAPIVFADSRFRAIKIRAQGGATRKAIWNIIKDENQLLEAIKCPLEGNYQSKNLATIFQVIDLLPKKGYAVSEEATRDGIEKVIENTGILGRWQVLGDRPRIICDVGHNEAGIRHILDQLKDEEYRKLHMVFGLVNDKDSGNILKLMPGYAEYYFCKADIPRGKDAEELRGAAAKFNLSGRAYASVREAYKAAKDNASIDDLIFIGGSTFVVAEVL